MFPLTTAIGTQRLSATKMACSASGRDASCGSSTILNLAVRSGEGLFQSKSFWCGFGRDSRFILSKDGWWSFIGRL